MLTATTFRGLRRESISGHAVVVEDAYGNPLAAVVEVASGQATIHLVTDPNFQAVLSALGLSKVVDVNQKKASSPGGELLISPFARKM